MSRLAVLRLVPRLEPVREPLSTFDPTQTAREPISRGPVGSRGGAHPSLQGIKARGGIGGLEPRFIRSSAAVCAGAPDRLPLSSESGAIRALPAGRGPARAGARGRLHAAPPAAPRAGICRASRSSSRRGGSPPSTFDAEGCGATRAATAAVAEMVDGETVIDAARIGTDEVDAAIGGLTPAKRHAAQLAADALHRALAGAAASAERLRRAAARAGAGRDVGRGRQRRRRAARTRARGGGRRGDAEALGRPARPTAPRPAARRRRCSGPGPSPTRSASRT